MKRSTSATIATTVVLLLLASCPAGANVFENFAAISVIRERSTEFGYDTSAYSDEDIRDFLRTIPRGELEEFRQSYDRRPNVGTTMTPELEAINRVECEREERLLDKWISSWEKHRSDDPPVSGSRREPQDSFAYNF